MLINQSLFGHATVREHSDSVVECSTRDQGAVYSSLTVLEQEHLSYFSTGSTQEDLSLYNSKIVVWMQGIKSNMRLSPIPPPISPQTKSINPIANEMLVIENFYIPVRTGEINVSGGRINNCHIDYIWQLIGTICAVLVR